MEIIYNLTPEEVDRVKFSIRFITDRQDRPRYFIPKEGTFVQSYAGMHRRDMYWIECKLNDTDLGNFLVEPNMKYTNLFTFCNYVKVIIGYAGLYNNAVQYFAASLEYKKQVFWAETLAEKIKQDERDNFQDTLISAKNI